MKKLIFFILAFLPLAVVSAKQVNQETAQRVATNFLHTQTNYPQFSGDPQLTLVYSCTTDETPISSISATRYLYVFNAAGGGFVIVAADDAVTPILGYSGEQTFTLNNIPQNVQKWLEGYKAQIRDVIYHQTPATREIEEAWSQYEQGRPSPSFKTTTVSPLLTTTWNQSPYYNSLCPSGSVTGCVATAMAQVMKYWNYPTTGSGFHSYNHQLYGTLSANFGSTTYQWSSMPNNVTSSNTAVATLMYHCGVSVDMDYSPQSSGAYVISSQSPVTNCAEYALKTYFGYKTTLQGVDRSNYTQTQWVNLMKTELNASRPIIYAGFGSGGGHCFVADGYDINDFLHFNWGWGGAYDGYFNVNALNPTGTGTGGGSGAYNNGQQAIIGIEPISTGGGSSATYNMALNSYVGLSASTIYYGQSFSVSTNIVNNGTNTFNGDYCAAIFDNNLTFIDYVQILTGNSLPGGYTYTNNLTFSSSGLLAMLPGTYTIAIFYRPTGGNWTIVQNGTFNNTAQITVTNPNDIELNSAMTVTPGTTLTQNSPVSVNLNIVNTGSSTFYGQYGLGLYKLDGTLAQSIDVISETNGLPSGYTYLSPYLTFNNSSVTVAPGSYLLAVQHNPNSTGWQLTGSSYYQNPIMITVQAPPLPPDPYEVNDAVSQAYALPVAFTGNSATKNTAGSSLHNTADRDYYKITLPAGYSYSINARLHDSYNSGNGITYTADCIFSYSTDGGNTWSATYDDVMPGNIQLPNGGTVYFLVSPYFAGESGTYLLNLTANRNGVNEVENVSLDNVVKTFPNPATESVSVDLSGLKEPVHLLEMADVKGKIVERREVTENGLIVLPVRHLANGTYFVNVYTRDGLFTQKVVVSK